MTSTSKRKQLPKITHEEATAKVTAAVRALDDPVSVELAVIKLMENFDFNLGELRAGLLGIFSNVRFREIAPYVGLDPDWGLLNIPTFDLNRSRIPTSLFKDIVEDMDVLLPQYGNLRDHVTEEARSRFLSPIFNRLVAEFGRAIRNTPELLMKGRITTRGRIEYHFQAFNNMALVFVEAKLKIGTYSERMDAIAQVIAECDACDYNNRRNGKGIPIHGILCDDIAFQFFSFDGSTNPHYTFSVGRAPVDRLHMMTLQDFSHLSNARGFILSLRPVYCRDATPKQLDCRCG
ncbi:hypothetical protein V8E53_009874 [Lactarius tabidus]